MQQRSRQKFIARQSQKYIRECRHATITFALEWNKDVYFIFVKLRQRVRQRVRQGYAKEGY